MTENRRPHDQKIPANVAVEPRRGEFANESKNEMQGEGNRDAALEYDAAQQEFVESGKVEEAARAAEPRSEQERAEMLEAERIGKSRAKK